MTWQVAAGTRTGPHHVRTGQDNQDAHAHTCTPEGVVILVVADGAGSLPSSRTGADLAVRTALRGATGLLDDGGDLAGAVQEGVHQARTALCARPDAGDVGCTLVVAAAGPTGWAVATVGDSFAVISTTEHTHELVRSTPAGEYPNITRLLTSTDPDMTVATGTGAPVALAVSTDGLTQATVTGEAPLPGFYTPLLTQTRTGTLDVGDLLDYMADRELVDDDATLLCAAREPERP